MKKEERVDAIQFRKDGSAIVADAAVAQNGRYWVRPGTSRKERKG